MVQWGRCGQCCRVPMTSTGYMINKETGYCKYIVFRDDITYCLFKEGLTEPKRAYMYWRTCCLPYPRESDIPDVPKECTYKVIVVTPNG